MSMTSPSHISPVLQIRLLGGCELERQGAGLRLETAKTSALLAYLAMQPAPQTRTKLAGLFWGDLPESNAYANLRHALWHLRSRLNLAGEPPFIHADTQTAAFDHTAAHFLDVAEFEKRLQNEAELQPQGAPTRPGCALLRDALDLYQGDFLDGLYLADAPEAEAWMIVERERLRSLATHALHRLVTYYLSWGEYEEGIVAARRLLAMEPWQEEAHRQLMRLLLLNNQRSAALEQYETCRRILAEELAVEPAPETQALCQSIRHNAEDARPLRFSGMDDRLPPQTTPFVGREDELARIAELLKKPSCRLISLVGPGGMGKTRLAIRAAAGAPQFGDGVYFVPLASIAVVDLLAPALADAMKFSFSGGENITAQLFTHLKNKNALLLLDNFEHLLDGADLVAGILRAAPGVKIMITTRERLNIREEWLFEVGGLSIPPQTPAATGGPVRVEDYSAVRLFVQSARRVRLDFALSEKDLVPISQLCRLVDGMPLALELAAAWTRTLSCEKITREVTHDLNLLATNQRDIPERHRSIRAVFENSWKRMSAAEREVLKHLTVFRDGFQLEAAQEICGASIPLLSALVDKSMLYGSTSGRYQMHELLRQYIAEKLSADEQAQDRDRHGRYYAGFLSQCFKDLSAGRIQQTLDEISTEFENVRASWNWAIETRQVEAVLQAHDSLYRFYELRNRFTEGEAALRQAAELLMAQPDAADHRITCITIVMRRARFFTRLARYGPAEELLTDCLRQADQTSPEMRQATARVLSELGLIALMTGDYPAAEERMQAALEINREINVRDRIVNMCNLGYVICQAGRYSQAAGLLRQVVSMSRAGGYQDAVAFGSYFLGLTVLGQEDVDAAANLFDEALGIYADLKHAWGMALCLHGKALVALERGRPAEAAQLAEEGAANARLIKDAHSSALCLNCLGRAASALGKEDEARAYFTDALQTAWQARQPPPALDSLLGMAAQHVKAGQMSAAGALLQLVSGHPATIARERSRARQLLAHIPADERGHLRLLTLEDAVNEVLGLESV